MVIEVLVVMINVCGEWQESCIALNYKAILKVSRTKFLSKITDSKMIHSL